MKDKNKIKILITGGAGFIGSNLVAYFLEETDWKINILDNLSTGSYENFKGIRNFSKQRVYFLKGNIENKKDVLKIIKGCDFLVNLAALTGVVPSQKDPLKTIRINIAGLVNLLEASRDAGIKKFIHISSGAALGRQTVPLNEKKIPCPLSVYGASKLAGEGYCSAYSATYGLNTIVLRFSSVYGPRSFRKESIVHKIIKQILKRETITIYGDGNQTRDFLYVKDACQAIFLSLVEEIPGKFEIFQIGTGKETAVNYLFNLIKKELRERGCEIKNPIYKQERPGEIKRNYADIGKAKEILNFQPRVELEKGIAKTIEFYILKS
jgi:UDP-glucose 4-epimerase